MDVKEYREKKHPSDKESYLEDQVNTLQKENKKLIKVIGEDRIITDLFEKRLTNFSPMPAMKMEVPKNPKKQTGKPEEMILDICDTHGDEFVCGKNMTMGDHYDFVVLLNRLWKLYKTFRSILEKERKSGTVIDDLLVIFGGDNMTGEIHKDALLGNKFYLPDGCVLLGWYYSCLIRMLAPLFPNGQVRVLGIGGNHMRMDTKPVFKKSLDRNWDLHIYTIMAMLLKDLPNTEFIIPRHERPVVMVNSWRVMVEHGHLVRSYGMTPYLNIERSTGDEHFKRKGFKIEYQNQEIQFDYRFLHHLHHEYILHGRIYGFPSMIGPNEYSDKNTRYHSSAGAKMLKMHPDHGISGSWLLNFEEELEPHGFDDIPKWTGFPEHIINLH